MFISVSKVWVCRYQRPFLLGSGSTITRDMSTPSWAISDYKGRPPTCHLKVRWFPLWIPHSEGSIRGKKVKD